MTTLGTRMGRAVAAALLMLTASAATGHAGASGSTAATTVGGRTPPLPEVEGPIAGPGLYLDPLEQNFPLSAAELGYVFEEYFVSGTAAGEPYTVRMLLARPADLDGA